MVVGPTISIAKILNQWAVQYRQRNFLVRMSYGIQKHIDNINIFIFKLQGAAKNRYYIYKNFVQYQVIYVDSDAKNSKN